MKNRPQKLPKSQFMFHKNCSQRDLCMYNDFGSSSVILDISEELLESLNKVQRLVVQKFLKDTTSSSTRWD